MCSAVAATTRAPRAFAHHHLMPTPCSTPEELHCWPARGHCERRRSHCRPPVRAGAVVIRTPTSGTRCVRVCCRSLERGGAPATADHGPRQRDGDYRRQRLDRGSGGLRGALHLARATPRCGALLPATLLTPFALLLPSWRFAGAWYAADVLVVSGTCIRLLADVVLMPAGVVRGCSCKVGAFGGGAAARCTSDHPPSPPRPPAGHLSDRLRSAVLV